MRWHYRDTVLTLCTVAFFATMVARLAISPVVPDVIEEFGISNTLMGLALTGMWLAYALSQFPSGVLSDRFGERRIILVAVGGTAIGSVLVAFAPRFLVLLCCTVLIGTVAGLHYTPATTLLSRMYDEIGTPLGVHSVGGPLAGVLAPVAAAWIGVRYGWRPAVAIAVVVAVPVFLLFAWRVGPTDARNPDRSMKAQFSPGSAASLLARPSIAFTVGIAIIVYFVWQGVASFLPTFLIEYRGYSPTFAGAVFSSYFLIQGILFVGSGAVSDRYGRDAVIAACMGAGIVGLTVFVVGDGIISIAVAVVALGIGLSLLPVISARFLDALSDEESGTGLGLGRTISGVLGAAGSVVVGLFADLFGWAVSFSFLVALLVLVLCALGVNRAFELGY